MKNFKYLKYVDNIEEEFDLGRLLGKGQFGKVYAATRKATKTECAIKIVSKSKLTKSSRQRLFINEMEVIQELTHPHIMGVHGVYHCIDNFYIVSELCAGGELYDRL